MDAFVLPGSAAGLAGDPFVNRAEFVEVAIQTFLGAAQFAAFVAGVEPVGVAQFAALMFDVAAVLFDAADEFITAMKVAPVVIAVLLGVGGYGEGGAEDSNVDESA